MKYICIHGHFYQPPRENPWLEAVERQDSAYPYTVVFTPRAFPAAGGPKHAVAVEPMSAPANALNSGIGLVWLEPVGDALHAGQDRADAREAPVPGGPAPTPAGRRC